MKVDNQEVCFIDEEAATMWAYFNIYDQMSFLCRGFTRESSPASEFSQHLKKTIKNETGYQ